MSNEIFVSEVFSAIQGEGAFVGTRQVFLRLSGCNIRCDYCDQPEALEKRAGPCRIERTPGHRDWVQTNSPIPLGAVASAVDRLWRSLTHHSVSVTGGEPLFQAQRLASLLPDLRQRSHRISLETNGTLPTKLEKVIDLVDFVSMDVKLDSVDHQGVDLDVQRRFLHIASRKHAFVKIVIGATTSVAEFERAVRMVDEESSDVEIFLQPVTPCGSVTAAPTPDQVLDLQSRALTLHPLVRVVPQTHKAIGQL